MKTATEMAAECREEAARLARESEALRLLASVLEKDRTDAETVRLRAVLAEKVEAL